MILTKHAQLREQQRAISPFMADIMDQMAIEWPTHGQRLTQLLKKADAEVLETEVKHLIRYCKKAIRHLKRIEKKSASKNPNVQIMSSSGIIITEANSSRTKRTEV